MYEERIIAFIDILGFKNEINTKTIESSTENENESETKRIYDFISFLWRTYDKRITDSTYQASQFSDSLVISYRADEKAALFKILMVLLDLQLEVVKYGLLLRGAITVGKLIHDNHCLFGPAMNSAYKLETEVSCFPRIIVDAELIKLAYNNPFPTNTPEDEEKIIKSLLELDFDGFYYIDYLNNGCKEIIAENGYDKVEEYFDKIQELIYKNKNTKDNRIRQKYNWLKRKYNSMIKNNNYLKNCNYQQLSE